MFSKACEYGIRAVIYIAVQSNEGKRVSLKSIAKEINSPEAFTAKILQELVKNEIIDSVKGPSGGFEVEQKKMKDIKLSHIVSAIDGDRIYKGCGLGLKDCSETHPCPVHNKFRKIRTDLRNMLENTTVYELSLGLKKGLTFLKT
ncbi:MAG TPA: Rrf2 family transcriptional regulator [Bacteroidia bacterium]|jgi:Rrf2 family protein|nr:Rrf2 family transcriptional regulator [Bacteroidia bacterium]HSH65054.1 Rrf2 family transcriptional regulator [Bacteroidia bacterium]